MAVKYTRRITKAPEGWVTGGAEYNGPCNCCGAEFRTMDVFVRDGFQYNKGILIIEDEVTIPESTKQYKYHIVNTKAGKLTVVTRHA